MYVIITLYQEKADETQRLISGLSEGVRNALPNTQQQVNSAWRGMMAHDVQRVEDLQRMTHPMAPPLRRGDFSYSGQLPTVPISVPTRGEYGSFQQMGFLHNTNDIDQAMPLMGRRIHSNQYEYYTFHHNNPSIKIPIKITGNREITDGQSINLDGYTDALQVKIYDLDAPRYIPY